MLRYRRRLRRADRFPGRHRGEHDLATADASIRGIAIIPCPGITCACNKCPHMARNTLEKLRDCLANGGPEIHWQPEFDRAKEVLERSLLQPAKKPVIGGLTTKRK